MEKKPEITVFEDGTKIWEAELGSFVVKTYLPKTELPADIVNFGFRAPYLMIFEEKRLTKQEAKEFADKNGFSEVASGFAGSVTFFYPLCEGGWENAKEDFFVNLGLFEIRHIVSRFTNLLWNLEYMIFWLL